MKQLLTTKSLIVGILALLFAGGSPVFAEQGEVAPVRITFSRVTDGWTLVVNSDGSGSITYGSSFGDYATFPKGTVAFGSLVQTAKGRKIVDSNDPEGVNVHLTKPEQKTTVGERRALAEDWNSLCRQIQPHLRSMNPERLNQLIKKYPLAKDLPEVPVKMTESPPKSPKPKPRKDKAK